jgi:hypothetical protein
MLSALQRMPLQRLSIPLLTLFGAMTPVEIDPTLPMFQALTHLELSDSSDRLDGLNVAAFPALTHLYINEPVDSPFLSDILRNCRSLRALVSMDNDRRSADELAESVLDSYPINDPRFVMVALSYDEYVEDWCAGAKCGSDYWFRADMFIAKKLRGEIQPSPSNLIFSQDPFLLILFSHAVLD